MIEIALPKVESVPVTDPEYHGQYVIEPLETGFAVTLGNALRRVLLSSLPGAAVTSIKIDNVYHEFSAIPDMKEDVTEFILNIKQIRLRSYSDRAVQCRLETSGGGVVTAGDIICPPDVEIVNPGLVLATMDGPDSRLSVELTVERGRGYRPAEANEPASIGVIPVDAIFTPMRKVNYEVLPVRGGQTTEHERLVLDVYTDGTVPPDEAVSQAAQQLGRHLSLLMELAAKPISHLEKTGFSALSIPAKVYDTPIEDLELSVRAYNCLKRAGITKVGQVLEMSEDDLLGVRNFGRKSLDELRERLASRDLLDKSRLNEQSSVVTEGEEEEDEEEEGEVFESTYGGVVVGDGQAAEGRATEEKRYSPDDAEYEESSDEDEDIDDDDEDDDY